MDAAGWLEITVEADGEGAEAVAELLSRYIPESIVIEGDDVGELGPGDPPNTSPGLRVRGYLALEPGWEAVRRQIEAGLYYLDRIRPLPPATFRIVEPRDWNKLWKERYRPVPIGRRLLILPPWLEHEQRGRLAVFIDPGMAFGTGTHPSTRLCLEFLEKWVPPAPGAIDIGCGSGVLAIAALKLGAHRALGVDIDSDAIRAARENAKRNGVADRIALLHGSLETARDPARDLPQPRLVFANILAPTILSLLEEGLGDLMDSRGTLVLSGILEEQEAQVERALEEQGLGLLGRRQQEDWVALAAGR